jgi:hypothetical protein
VDRNLCFSGSVEVELRNIKKFKILFNKNTFSKALQQNPASKE